jgi:hypothetical protein
MEQQTYQSRTFGNTPLKADDSCSVCKRQTRPLYSAGYFGPLRCGGCLYSNGTKV